MNDYYNRRVSRRHSRGWLFVPFLIFLIFAGLYSAYWVWMRGELDKGVDQWIADQRAAGFEIDYASKRLVGYPFRFALHLEQPEMADPKGLRWRGETLQLVMQPWNLQHVIGRSPGRNRVESAQTAPMEITLGDKSALSLSWDQTSLRRVGLTIDAAEAQTSQGAAMIEDLRLSLGPKAGAEDDLRIAAQWTAMRLPSPPPEAAWLGETLAPGRIAVDVSQLFPALESATALSRWTALEGRVTIAQILVDWGPMKLGVKGDLGLDRALRLNGSLSTRIDEADRLRAALREAGALDAQTAQTVDILETASANGQFATVSFVDGEAVFLGRSLGEVPVADTLAALFAP
ncbi:MAG: DUF2125 domain-containing protein [Pseudomonadota bacterium]